MEETKQQMNTEESSLCFQLIKEQQRTIRIAIVAFAAAVVAINLGWLAFFNGYAFESTEVTVDSETGTAIYQSTEEGSNTINGDSKSKK